MEKTKAVEFTETEYDLIKNLFLAVTNDPAFPRAEMFQQLDFLHLMAKFVGTFDEPPISPDYAPPVTR